MKSKYFVIIWVLFLSADLNPASAVAGNAEGNGGDVFVKRINQKSLILAERLLQARTQMPPDLGVDIVVLAAKLRAENVGIETTTSALYIFDNELGRNREVNAKNFPDEDRIIFNLIALAAMDDEDKNLLLLHENLGLIGSDEGLKFPISSRIIAALKMVDAGASSNRILLIPHSKIVLRFERSSLPGYEVSEGGNAGFGIYWATQGIQTTTSGNVPTTGKPVFVTLIPSFAKNHMDNLIIPITIPARTCINITVDTGWTKGARSRESCNYQFSEKPAQVVMSAI